jgi:hypothetical protein
MYVCMIRKYVCVCLHIDSTHARVHLSLEREVGESERLVKGLEGALVELSILLSSNLHRTDSDSDYAETQTQTQAMLRLRLRLRLC